MKVLFLDVDDKKQAEADAYYAKVQERMRKNTIYVSLEGINYKIYAYICLKMVGLNQ